MLSTKPFRNWRIASQLMAIICPAILLVVGTAAWSIHQHNVTRLYDKLVTRAQSISLQVTADRDYYTRVIIPRILDIGGNIGAEYRQTHGQFPLPVVFIQEVSSQLSAQGALFDSRLISPWPINPRRGLSDPFQRKAFEYLQGNPTGQFYRLDTLEGRSVFRYLTADRATAQSCIDCHNSHPRSVRHDFKLNDVIGGLEIIIPADQYLQEDHDDLVVTLAGGAGLSLLLMGLLTIGTRYIIAHPLTRLSDRLDRDSNKITGGVAVAMAGSWGRNELVRFEAFVEKLRAQIFAEQSKVQQHEAALAIQNVRLHEQVEHQTRVFLASEQQLQTTLDCANDAIMYIDLDGTIQWCNGKTERLTGWLRPDLIGRPLWAFLAPESTATAQDRLAAVKTGGVVPSRVEFEIITRTGSSVMCDANIASVKQGGQVVGRVLVLRDRMGDLPLFMTSASTREHW